MANLSIIGAGAWGSALAIALADNFDTIYLHTHTQKEVSILQPRHPTLPVDYPDNIKLIFDLSLVQDSASILIAVPSYAFSNTLKTLKPLLTKTQPVAWGTKGFDTNGRCFFT